MASRITPAQKEAMIYGLNLNVHPKDIAVGAGVHVRRVYEMKEKMQFAVNNQPRKQTGWAERLKYDFRKLFKKDAH